ncbi:MAG TPA: hypothetical protein VN832_11575 [Stellaceae bacterium]|nr:hypothetical protein [Stellaceae bacterium]
MNPALRVSRYFVIFAVVWMIGMTWRIYPQFKDTIRVDGRLTNVADYLDEVCGQRVGPAAAACLAEMHKRARILLRREQGKSILLIDAPLLGYLLLYLPLRLAYLGVNRRRGADAPPAAQLGAAPAGDLR